MMETPELSFFASLIKMAKENNLKRVKCLDFEFEFYGEPNPPKSAYAQALDEIENNAQLKPTEDELLYYSTDYDPEVRSKPEVN